MKAEERLLDAIGEIDGKKIQRAHESVRRRRPRVRWGAAVAAVLLIVSAALVTTRHRGKWSAGGDGGEPFRIAAAVYPSMAPYPISYEPDAYSRWWASVRAQYAGIDSYTGKLDGFLSRSIPAFLSGNENENRVYSPLSLYLAAAMLAETAGGESRAQLLELLGAEDLDTLRERASALWNANYQDDGSTECILSASLWLDRDVAFVQRTMDTLARDYYASSYCGEMGDRDFDAAVQSWLNENTRGLLAEDAAQASLDPETIMALFTTVYYHGSWYTAFPEQETESAVFHAKTGDVTCDYLHESTWSDYYWGDRFSAASKPIETGSRQHTMWFLLPDEGVTPEELLSDPEVMRLLLADKRAWIDGREAWDKSAFVELNLSVPRFDVSSKTDLIGGLKELGVTDVFDPAAADFSPAVKNTAALLPYISKAEHSARLAIDEKGVTAAACTEFEMRSGGSPVQPEEKVDFVLDRPFVFVLTGADDLPLFVGVVNRP